MLLRDVPVGHQFWDPVLRPDASGEWVLSGYVLCERTHKGYKVLRNGFRVPEDFRKPPMAYDDERIALILSRVMDHEVHLFPATSVPEPFIVTRDNCGEVILRLRKEEDSAARMLLCSGLMTYVAKLERAIDVAPHRWSLISEED